MLTFPTRRIFKESIKLRSLVEKLVYEGKRKFISLNMHPVCNCWNLNEEDAFIAEQIFTTNSFCMGASMQNPSIRNLVLYEGQLSKSTRRFILDSLKKVNSTISDSFKNLDTSEIIHYDPYSLSNSHYTVLNRMLLCANSTAILDLLKVLRSKINFTSSPTLIESLYSKSIGEIFLNRPVLKKRLESIIQVYNNLK